MVNDLSYVILQNRKRKKSYGTRGGIVFNICKRIKKGTRRFCIRCCPSLYRLLSSHRTEFRAVKAMLGFPVGVLFGYALYKIVLERLQLTESSSRVLGATLALCLGIGYATSSQVRCMCFLTVPMFCGKTGRAYISTFVITFIITGPLDNIMFNAHESLRVMSCITSLSLNHTMERFKLMFAPLKDIIRDFATSGKKVQNEVKGIESVYKPLENEVKDEEEAKKARAETNELDKEVKTKSRVAAIENKFNSMNKGKYGSKTEALYGMKSELRCEGIFNKGVKGCYKSFGAAYDRCHSYLPIIGYILCWPMKLTFICDLAGSIMGKRSCDSASALNPGFGESIDTAAAVEEEFKKGFEVSMQYKLVIPEQQVDLLTPSDVSQAMEDQFDRRKKNFDFLMNMISRIFAFMFIQVFNLSRKYCDQYLRIIQFDNKYTTTYFRHIDARRHKQGKLTLLPLKKGEMLELSDPFAVTFSGEEKALMMMSTLRLIGEMVTVSILFLFDRTFYEFLMLIQRHSHVEYKQTGVHHISMEIYGDGFIGQMVRGILKGFDKKHTTDQVTNSAKCLPLPRKLDSWMVARVYLTYALIFVLMLFESYSLRMRRVICSFFYPKREKKRIIFLYNDRLKKRRSYLHHMRHRVRKMARHQAIALDTGVLVTLLHSYPKYFWWLEKTCFIKRKCLVCEEIETKKAKFVTCSEECPFSYCSECWQDMKEKCYVCLPDDEFDSELSDEDTSE